MTGEKTEPDAASLTYGMIGGGQNAFIGEVHRKAIAMDGGAELAAGCFSTSYDNTLATGRNLGLDKERLYRTYQDMFKAEAQREDPIDFVVIVTPNDTHFAMAEAALNSGIHVVCDKPLATDSGQAEELARLAGEKKLLFGITYTYTGYPMVKHIRDMIAAGKLGTIRFVNAEYPQDWLAESAEKNGQKQALWRNDPEKSGPSNCLGDIGSHIENMVSYLTGLTLKKLCARLDTLVEGRLLDDNAAVMTEYDSGAKGLYWCSQIAVGHDNGLRVRIYGSRASVEWAQEYPNQCRISYLDKPAEILSRGKDELSPAAEHFSRIPAGHPEGYFEAFANIYRSFTGCLSKIKSGREPG
ncbi:MAG: Gfo/Idh/MocA family protein, partial [Candidatus Aminicenantaceae bacterium]